MASLLSSPINYLLTSTSPPSNKNPFLTSHFTPPSLRRRTSPATCSLSANLSSNPWNDKSRRNLSRESVIVRVKDKAKEPPAQFEVFSHQL
ncbi:Phosphatidate cytidylyltransferase 5 chloroplastic [Bienertia sinuspersici]